MTLELVNRIVSADAVNAATKHLAGDKSGIVPALISLKVVKPDAPDLTLIDFPGIVRNHLPDQPQDIEQQIRDVIYKHIEGWYASFHVCLLA